MEKVSSLIFVMYTVSLTMMLGERGLNFNRYLQLTKFKAWYDD